jgi:helicase
VVVRDQRRYTGEEMAWLPVLEVHQMCGRAGRPGLDPYGEAVLVAGEDGDPDALWERYVDADPEAVESRLADRAALRTHVLSVVASGFADSREGLLDVFDATFYAHRGRVDDLSAVVDDALADLERMGMVTTDDGLAATELGARVSRQYLSPEGGARVVEGLRTMAAMENPTTLTALELVCHTPDVRTGWLGNRERADVYRFAAAHADEFTTAMGEVDDFEGWLAAVKTARVLAAWADGVDADEVVDRFRVGPGDLESRVERATWLLGAADALAGHLDVDLPVVRETRDRLNERTVD